MFSKTFKKSLLILIVCFGFITFNGCGIAQKDIESNNSVELNDEMSEAYILSDANSESTVTIVSDSSQTDSDTENSFQQEENFVEDDIFAQMFNNYFYPSHCSFNYSFIYKNADATYLTMYAESFSGSGLYCYTNQGEKSYIADDSWRCYVNNGVLYYLEIHQYDKDGGIEETRRLISYNNGKKTILINNVGYFYYSKNGIYYVDNDTLCKMSYDGNNKEKIYKLTEGDYGTFLEYENYLWVFSIDSNQKYFLHKVSLDGTEISSVPMITDEIKVRNHYFYFHDYSAHDGTAKFFRYSTIKGEIEELPYINAYMEPINFTDNYFLFEDGDWLYRADKNFDKVEKIIDIGTIEELNVQNNFIYVIDVVENQDGLLEQVIKQYDTDGNLIKTYE